MLYLAFSNMKKRFFLLKKFLFLTAAWHSTYISKATYWNLLIETSHGTIFFIFNSIYGTYYSAEDKAKTTLR